jgi:hypothetical protein
MGFENGQPVEYVRQGRPPGAKNKRTTEFVEFREKWLANGGQNPLERIFKLAESQDEGIALQASQWLEKVYGLPYFPKSRVPVPKFQSIKDAEAYLVTIAMQFGDGEIDPDTALALSTLVRTWISVKHQDAEIELKKIHIDGPGEQTIRIDGGLPALPGTNITMPLPVNGHEINGHALDPPAIESSSNDSSSSEPRSDEAPS